MVHNISGVILAGGANKRFNGITKTKIVIGGQTILSRITDILSKLFDEIIIVTNTPEEFKEYNNFKITGDKFLRAGPLGGIHAALKESSKEAAFVFAGDMPLLDKDLIFKQMEYYNGIKCDILVPRMDQFVEPLHAIYNISLLKTLESYLAGDNSYAVTEFFKQAAVRYYDVGNTIENRRAFTNINSPGDVPEIEKMIGSGD